MTEKENKRLLKLIDKGIKAFPKVLARKEKAYQEKKKRLKAFKPIAKSLQKELLETEQSKIPAHPWRLCPAGQFYRTKHLQKPYIRKNGTQVRGGAHPNECVRNKTGRDQL